MYIDETHQACRWLGYCTNSFTPRAFHLESDFSSFACDINSDATLQRFAVSMPEDKSLDDVRLNEDGSSGTAIAPICSPDKHKWRKGVCMVCAVCGECTGYGSSCINSSLDGRYPGTWVPVVIGRLCYCARRASARCPLVWLATICYAVCIVICFSINFLRCVTRARWSYQIIPIRYLFRLQSRHSFGGAWG